MFCANISQKLKFTNIHEMQEYQAGFIAGAGFRAANADAVSLPDDTDTVDVDA